MQDHLPGVLGRGESSTKSRPRDRPHMPAGLPLRVCRSFAHAMRIMYRRPCVPAGAGTLDDGPRLVTGPHCSGPLPGAGRAGGPGSGFGHFALPMVPVPTTAVRLTWQSLRLKSVFHIPEPLATASPWPAKSNTSARS